MAAASKEPASRGARRGRPLGAIRVVAVVAAVALVATVAIVLGWRGFAVADGARSARASLDMSSAEPTSAAPARVEMPAVIGLDLRSAEMVLAAAGMTVQVSSDPSGAIGSHHVVDQEPEAGVLTEQGATAALFTRSVAPTASVSKARGAKATKRSKRVRVVCIDPGHQARGDVSPEPIGPGSKTVKPSVSGGATGVFTLVPEYEIALQVSMNLKRRLEARGIKVVMTRMTNDVSLSNAERAQIANKADADLFVRIHADGGPDATAAGVSTLYPASNKWTKPIFARSKRAARVLHQSVLTSTDAVDRGVVARGDQSGFNWSSVPVVLVECGYLSNSIEDRLLASPHYQDKVAEGIAGGVVAYLRSAE